MKTEPIGRQTAAGAAPRSRELLELRLRKTRLQAESKRLEALAAELEIQLHEWQERRSATDDAAREDAADALEWAPYERAARANLAAAGMNASNSPPTVAERQHDSAGADEPGCYRAVVDQAESDDAADDPTTDEKDGEFSIDAAAGEHPIAPIEPAAEEQSDRPAAEIAVDCAAEDSEKKRRGWPGWITSAIAHGIAACLLMFISLRTPRPQDAIALSASPAVASEPLETMEFEATEAPETENEPATEEVETTLADLKAPVDAVELSSGPRSDAAQLLETGAADFSSVGEMLAVPDAADGPATVFYGIEEGGNNLCFIVDRSLSMKDGRFEAARNELLRTVDALPPDKRFYVIFYASTLEQMRLDSSGAPEPYAVPATARNKAALRRWAMTVGLERGAPPDDALEVALQLAPDVIFLLSDGEFPERIERLLDEKNRRESLFGDEGPRSIIHTIGFYSRDGEARLRRIAKKNGGRYTYVAEPQRGP